MVLIFAFPCLVPPALLFVDLAPTTLMPLLTRFVRVGHLIVALALCCALVVGSAGVLFIHLLEG